MTPTLTIKTASAEGKTRAACALQAPALQLLKGGQPWLFSPAERPAWLREHSGDSAPAICKKLRTYFNIVLTGMVVVVLVGPCQPSIDLTIGERWIFNEEPGETDYIGHTVRAT